MKLCKHCETVKSFDSFPKNKNSKDGHNSMCKSCKKNYDSFYRSRKEYKDKELLRGRSRRHYDWSNKLHMTKQNAKARNLEFTITIDDVPIPDKCPLTNIKLVMGPNRWSKPSIDRIDSTKGYIPGNVWVISVLANTMKSIATKEQLLTFSKNVIKIFDN